MAIKISRVLTAFLALTAIIATSAKAEVERIEITERTPLADGAAFGEAGPYEKIRGIAWISLDPDNKANARIVDLRNTQRDAHNHVVFKTDFLMLRPADPARRNGALLYEVNNRGRIGMLGQLQDKSPAHNDPTTREDMGNAFLLKRGYTLLWSAWTWDTEVPTAEARVFHLDPPVVTDHGRTITGRVIYEALVDKESPTMRFAGFRARSYPQADGAAANATMTERDAAQGARRTIDRDKWRFIPGADGLPPDTVALDGGFQPGRLYEISYVARDPVVVGAGLAGIRDLMAWFKYNSFADAPPIDRSLIFGISQSGRVIATMLHLGLTLDERGRPAIDGAYAQVSGAGKGSFNHRFAMPTRHFSQLVDQGYPTDYFPFATVPTHDPITDTTASLLDTAKRNGHLPKIFFANTSAEYWSRSASLLTTTPDGKADVGVDPSVRIYFISGAQHYVAGALGGGHERFPRVNCANNAYHYPVERALLTRLDEWVRGAAEPPANAFPTIGKGELVDIVAYKKRFPIAEERRPDSQLKPPYLDLGPRFATQGIIDRIPPVAGKSYGTLIPAPDKNGNDRSGIRSVELEVPLGTYTGWNLRAPSAGFPGVQARYDGSFIPFARTRAELEPGDSRMPLDERYQDKADFEHQVRAAAEREVAAGFLLPGDVDTVIARQSGLYDKVLAHEPTDLSCDYLYP